MSFEDRILKLCALAAACQTEAQAMALTQELRTLLHEHIEHLRDGGDTLSERIPNKQLREL